jgi:hypothetical protein
LDGDEDKFAKFLDRRRKFKEFFINDARGMLSLYEATHDLRVHGEDILNEAPVFTATHLEAVPSCRRELLLEIIWEYIYVKIDPTI